MRPRQDHRIVDPTQHRADAGQPRRCSRCKEPGHRAPTCTAPIWAADEGKEQGEEPQPVFAVSASLLQEIAELEEVLNS